MYWELVSDPVRENLPGQFTYENFTRISKIY